ncbi:TolB family protein [Priestia flexa]
MRRFFLCFFMIVLLPNTVQSASNFKVSFIRDGDVWIYENGKETKIPSSNEASEPVWSKDGSYIAYKNGKSLMAASVKGKQTEIEKNVQSYQWSPTGMELAYISNNILTIYNVKQKKKSHVALGVDQFSWFPDGEKFLITESATLSPRGWGAVKLYTVEKMQT